jgi:exopolysaccharide biosynthesis operon protein EpsL
VPIISTYRYFSLSLGLICLPALSQVNDIVKYRGNISNLSDDNFLRSTTSRSSDQITSETAGVNVVLPYSLQRFELDASLTANQHQVNTGFDYIAQNYNAAWFWSFTPQLHGSVTSARADSLNAANDSLNPALRNKNTTQNSALSAAYDLGGPWQITAGISNTNTSNERPLTEPTDNRSSGVNVGVRFAPTSGNSLAYSFQTASGSAINDYTSNTHEVAVVWQPRGDTSFSARLASLDQHFSTVPQFDFNGLVGAVNIRWRATSKISVTGGWQRDLASYQTLGTTHTQTDSTTLGPVWQISAKTAISLQYRYAERDNQGNPTGSIAIRKDRLRDTSFSYKWQLRPLTTISASLNQSTRNTDIPNADFTANQVTVGAQFLF